VDRLDVAEGNAIELDRVLLLADGDKITVGTPVVDGARVMATSLGEGKGKKIIVLKYKPKIRYHKKTGHRQFYTKLLIDEIVETGTKDNLEKKTRRHKKEVIVSGT